MYPINFDSLNDSCDDELIEPTHAQQFDFDFELGLPEDSITDDYPIIVKKYGCKCDKCEEFYPDAEAVTPFKCWSCRNF